jgi:hypothetical protein
MARAAIKLLSLISAFGLAAGVAADSLTISATPNPAQAGTQVTFRFTPRVLASGDEVDFDFGDGATGTVAYTGACGLLGGCGTITHTYAGALEATVTATGTVAGNDVSGSLALSVTGSPEDSHLYIATGAHLQGYNSSRWRTDVWVDNPGPDPATYTIALLERDQANTSPPAKTYSLTSGSSVAYHDILLSGFDFTGAAALRIVLVSGQVLVTSRTYNQPGAGTYGQFVPAVPRSQAISYGQSARLLGLSHDPSLAAGFRTNIGLVNASAADIHVDVAYYKGGGGYLGTVGQDLSPYEFVQLDRAFESVTSDVVTDGFAVVHTTTADGKFLAYASVVDNLTGDPTFVPAQIAH